MKPIKKPSGQTWAKLAYEFRERAEKAEAEVGQLRGRLGELLDIARENEAEWSTAKVKALTERDDALAEVERLNKGLRDIRDQLYEAECDCPPEWPRCSYCKTRLRIQALLRKDEP